MLFVRLRDEVIELSTAEGLIIQDEQVAFIDSSGERVAVYPMEEVLAYSKNPHRLRIDLSDASTRRCDRLRERA
jgi:hypothetical protein